MPYRSRKPGHDVLILLRRVDDSYFLLLPSKCSVYHQTRNSCGRGEEDAQVSYSIKSDK
jgi:hypothetical protein